MLAVIMRLGVKSADWVRDAHPRGRARAHRRHRTCSNSPEVDAANAGNWGLSVEGSGTRKRRDNLERLLKFLGEHVVVVAIG